MALIQKLDEHFSKMTAKVDKVSFKEGLF